MQPTNEPFHEQKPEALAHCLASTVCSSLAYMRSSAIGTQAQLYISYRTTLMKYSKLHTVSVTARMWYVFELQENLLHCTC